jgi:hypothetical protein
VLALGLVISARADDKKPDGQAKDVAPAANVKQTSFPKMEIFNGTARSVHYYGDASNLSEQVALADLERAENELAYTRQLQMLKTLYVQDDAALQGARRAADERILDRTAWFSTGIYPDLLPVVDTEGFRVRGDRWWWPGYSGWHDYSGAYGNGNNASLPLAVSGPGGQNWAVGPPTGGWLKTELSRQVANQATPEFRAEARRDLGVALASLGKASGNILPAGMPRKMKVTLKGGKTYEGSVVKDDANFLTLDTDGSQVDIAQSEILTKERPK